MSSHPNPKHPPIAVDVWFDAACPFAWATSRWLLEAAETRPVQLRWHLMSLAVLNEGKTLKPEQAQRMTDSRASGRLLAAVTQTHGPHMLPAAYTSLGTRLHSQAQRMTPDVATVALSDCGADIALATALDDPRYDDDVQRSHHEGQNALGETGGSPIVSIDGTAFFGPVLTAIPHGRGGLDLFDAITVLGRSAAFSQIQRPRSGPPDFS